MFANNPYAEWYSNTLRVGDTLTRRHHADNLVYARKRDSSRLSNPKLPKVRSVLTPNSNQHSVVSQPDRRMLLNRYFHDTLSSAAAAVAVGTAHFQRPLILVSISAKSLSVSFEG